MSENTDVGSTLSENEIISKILELLDEARELSEQSKMLRNRGE